MRSKLSINTRATNVSLRAVTRLAVLARENTSVSLHEIFIALSRRESRDGRTNELPIDRSARSLRDNDATSPRAFVRAFFFVVAPTKLNPLGDTSGCVQVLISYKQCRARRRGCDDVGRLHRAFVKGDVFF